MSKKRTIMVVDDDSNVLETTQYLLMNRGYTVYSAIDGLDAIEKYKTEKPDVVFMDIRMPRMNGYDAFFQIIKKYPNAKIIFTSAYAIDDTQFQRAIDHNLAGFISKPFSIEDLEKYILINSN